MILFCGKNLVFGSVVYFIFKSIYHTCIFLYGKHSRKYLLTRLRANLKQFSFAISFLIDLKRSSEFPRTIRSKNKFKILNIFLTKKNDQKLTFF